MRIASVLLVVVGSLIAPVYSLQAEDQPRSLQPTQAKSPDGNLRQRAVFGVAPVTKDVRDRQKLGGDGGGVLEEVFPETSAADAESKAGDVILAIDEARLSGVPMLLDRVADARASAVLTLEVTRAGPGGWTLMNPIGELSRIPKLLIRPAASGQTEA